MKTKTWIEWITLTMGLCIGLGAVLSAAFRINIAENWDAKRCDPYVVPMAGFFKPAKDPRTAVQFARDNWSFCQKEYIQNALRTAAQVPKDLADAEAGVGGLAQDLISGMADVFFDIWNFCYEAYSTFMDNMKGAAKLFQNMLIQMHSIVERLHGATLSIVYGLISLIVAFISGVQVFLIVAIIVIGILIALQIILFFILLPISGLIITMTAVIAVVVVAVATAIMAATVAERFSPGVCFSPDTWVTVHGGYTQQIYTLNLGDILGDGGRVTALHKFKYNTPMYTLHGINVTGDHLVMHPNSSHKLIAVKDHPDAVLVRESLWNMMRKKELWCLTTTTRRIPVEGTNGVEMFGDWEELPIGDISLQQEWNYYVSRCLNGYSMRSVHIPLSEQALSPDCMLEAVSLFGKEKWIRAKDVQIGDTLGGGAGRVVGITVLESEEVEKTDVIMLPSIKHGYQCVSNSIWIHEADIWTFPRGFIKTDYRPPLWYHFYTENGYFRLTGGWTIRDASEVGLSNLQPIVQKVVVENQEFH